MAYVLTSLSGNLISAASAGYAPTISGDVSAIASAYQVVSATATQLNAGTAYLTSVNETPISASRAGNAANASLATSAWYDGTGRFISSLPDEATVSSIASSYAESAASGKQNSGNYISAKGLTQTISNADSSLQVSFGSDNETAYGSKVAGLFITGSFGTAYYKDNELNLNRNNMKIAFNIGGQGPKITSMATGTGHPYMYLFASGKNSGIYSDTGIVFTDSGNNTVALYDSSTYGDITSVYDTVSANSAAWGQGGADSSAMSAIASAYAESAEANCWPLSASDIVRSTGNGFSISYGNAFFTVAPIAGGSTNPGYLKYQYAGWPTADFGLSNSAVYGGNTFQGTSYYFLLTKSGLSGRYLSGDPASAFYWQYTKAEYDNLTSVTDTVSSNSASWAGGITGDYLTAQVGSGQATFSTALQDGMDKRPALIIEAQRSAGSKMYPRMIITDWNDTTGDTHSGALLSNAFEFYICPQSARGEVAPSGIVQSRLDASRLQFNIDSAVSSFTRSAEFTRSGMRLGMSANTASWVAISGNSYSGGFVTLDDGSGVSGRIVASSVGYWNDKLDGSASSSYYTTANESGYVGSAYVDSAVSGKQDSLTFAYDANNAISSINGSALAGGGGGGTTYITGSAASVVVSADDTVVVNSVDVTSITIGSAVNSCVVQWTVNSTTTLPTIVADTGNSYTYKAAGNNPTALTVGKTYQLSILRDCWVIAEFG